MASQALQALKRTVTVDWPKRQQAEAKAFLIRTAREGHAQIMREADGALEFEAYGGSPGRPIESVKVPEEAIVYNYFRHREIVIVALRALRDASPRVSGAYRDGHTVYVNDVPVPALPINLKRGDRIVISNPVPYSRKLEIGKTESGRDFLISVPNRIYERVAKRVLIPKYGKVAGITFGYYTPPNASRLQRNNPARSWLANKGRWHVQPAQRADRAAGAVVRSPAIFIEML